MTWRRRGGNAIPQAVLHVRRQLAALPALTSLALRGLSCVEEGDDQQAARLPMIGGTITRLELFSRAWQDAVAEGSAPLHRLPMHFPALRELHADDFMVDDEALEAMLTGLPHLRRLHVWEFKLRRSHAHHAVQWSEVAVHVLDVGSFARLPLDGILSCRGLDLLVVDPSADPAAVARVAEAVRRWGGWGDDGGQRGWVMEGSGLLTTMQPLVAALPAAQQSRLRIYDLPCAALLPVGRELPASVTTLRLSVQHDSFTESLGPNPCWADMLPGLPASVEELRLDDGQPQTEEHLLGVCRAAVRPIRLAFPAGWRPTWTPQDLQRIREALAGGPGEMVTLSTF